MHLTLILAAVTSIGVVTEYRDPYTGGPLKCGDLTYSHETPPWIALPVVGLGETWECWDVVRVVTPHGTEDVYALDAGPLSLYRVGDAPIVGDLPWDPLPGLSAPATLINLSALGRALEEKRIPVEAW